MKKLLSALLLLILIFSLCACSKNEGKNTLPTHGTIEGNTYTSSFANITFTAPEGWEFLTDSELLANTDNTGNKITDEALGKIFKEVGLAYDMVAHSDSLRCSVGLIFANTEHEEFKGLSVEELLNTMIEQTGLDTSGGITEDSVDLCGNSYTRFCLTAKTGTGETGYATFYGRQKDDAVILIVAACTDSFTVADCESCFG